MFMGFVYLLSLCRHLSTKSFVKSYEKKKSPQATTWDIGLCGVLPAVATWLEWPWKAKSNNPQDVSDSFWRQWRERNKASLVIDRPLGMLLRFQMTQGNMLVWWNQSQLWRKLMSASGSGSIVEKHWALSSWLAVLPSPVCFTSAVILRWMTRKQTDVSLLKETLVTLGVIPQARGTNWT